MRVCRLIILLVPLVVIVALGLICSSIVGVFGWLDDRCAEWFEAIWEGK